MYHLSVCHKSHLAVRSGKKISAKILVIRNSGPLKALNDTKLILHDAH